MCLSVCRAERIPDVSVTAGCHLCAVAAAFKTSSTAQAESREKDGKKCSVHDISTVGGTSVFGRRVTTMWINRPLEVSQLGQLSLSSFRVR